MPYEDLLLEKEGVIATLTLNAPQKLNALTRKMQTSLPLAVDEIAKDDEVRVVIVTGAGRGFCAGADVSAMAARDTGEAPEMPLHMRIKHLGWPHADAFPKLNKPVIAAINGPCVGGGFSLAMSCDIRIASEAAKFSAIWISHALVPDWGATYLLPRIVGMSKALELMFTGDIFTAADAERLGIISRVVPPGDLMKVTRELANKIAQQAPIPVSLAKKMVWRGLFDGLTRQLDLETWAQAICHDTEDHKESVRAFMEKRPLPQFKGR